MFVCVVALGHSHAANPDYRISGTVQDSSGAAVPNAVVELRSHGWSSSVTTDAVGRFHAENVPPTGTLVVHAPGFADATLRWMLDAVSAPEVNVVLSPAGAASEVTVAATRTELPLSQSPASVQVLTNQRLQNTAAVALDDALRQVAGFNLFRRTSSRVSNPTSQGVSLRGVGASGASRAVVLVDGVPLNDPFGGWIYWDRVPRNSVGNIEVLNGGASALYGTDALGGVIDITSRRITRPALALDLDYGSNATPNGSLDASASKGKWGGAIAAEGFSTDGYVLVDKAERGAVDVPADSSHRIGEITIDRKIFDSGRLFGTGSWFREQRGNGTPLQVNDTGTEQGIFGGDFGAGGGTLAFRTYGGAELFHQSFSTIAVDRNSERLNRLQTVPVTQLGLNAQWVRSLGARNVLVAGGDVRDVRGHSFETAFSTVTGATTSIVDAGGRQRTTGFFVEDILHATSRLMVNAVARFDRWRNFDAFSNTTPLTAGAPILNNLAPRSESAFSPRVGLNYRLTNSLALTAAGYRSFRAPTLNELYRAFRVGNVLTLANNALEAEHLTGAEAGLVGTLGSRIVARGTFFWNDITRPIANVTLTTTPALITRQRQNLGRTRSAGVDASVEAKVTSAVMAYAGYEYANATVTSFSANPALVGLWVPQVPHQQFTFGGWYANPRLLTFSLQGRAVGQQYDDDLNQFPLGSLFTIDAFASRALTHGVELFVGAENLTNQRYTVGRTPVRTLGPSIQARIGLRVRLGER